MTQTADHISGADFLLEFSDDSGVGYDDISGSVTSVIPSGGELNTGESYTAEGDHALVSYGKYSTLTLDVICIYTETAGEAWKLVKAAVDAKKKTCRLRWAPGGGVTGNARFETPDGAVVSSLLPAGDANSAGPLTIAFQWKGSGAVTEDTVPA